MNSHAQQSKSRDHGFPRGQAMVELAGALVVLVPLLLVAVDFGRLYFTNVEVVNAARAGAQYGSQSVITAADTNGIKAAAVQDASDLSGMSATATQCTCATTTVVAACPTSYCTNSPGATFVEVDTSTTFNTIVSYPGIPHSVTLAGKAVMMVEE